MALSKTHILYTAEPEDDERLVSKSGNRRRHRQEQMSGGQLNVTLGIICRRHTLAASIPRLFPHLPPPYRPIHQTDSAGISCAVRRRRGAIQKQQSTIKERQRIGGAAHHQMASLGMPSSHDRIFIIRGIWRLRSHWLICCDPTGCVSAAAG